MTKKDKIIDPPPVSENGPDYAETKYFTFNELAFDSGEKIGPVTIAYETYGRLNGDRSNAILVCHALTGEAHAAGFHKGDSKPGWWDNMVGAGKAFDTDKYFVISSIASLLFIPLNFSELINYIYPCCIFF